MTSPWLVFPLFSLFVAVVWMLLWQSVGLGSIILGLGLGIFSSFALSRLQAPGIRPSNIVATARLLGHVAVEIWRSNVAVARIILRPAKERKSGFLEIPLRLKDPQALAILSMILTATPGSLWVDYDAAEGKLLLHVLDLIDEETWIEIVGSYERRLKEIFE